MSSFATHVVARRADQAALFMVAVLLLLCGTFFRLQIVHNAKYAVLSSKDRLKPLPLTAPRGEIVDRNGMPIVQNIPGYSIKLLAESDTALRSVLIRMSELVPGDSIDIPAVIRRWNASKFRPAVVFASGSDSTVAILEEHRAVLPGLIIQNEPRRFYTAGAGAAHLTGYLGEVSAKEQEKPQFMELEPGELVGKDGLEAEYDSMLRGRTGFRYVEVTASGHVVRNPPSVGIIPPVLGTSIKTTIDLPLQMFIDSMWRAAMPDKSGAMLAMTPSGEILAYISFPSFDPNAFIGPVNTQAIREAFGNPKRALFNRVIAGKYPPASPWKLVTSIIGLRTGRVTMDTRMPIGCNGGMNFGGRYFRCWKPEGHGNLTLAQAIQVSCDVYFYQLGTMLGKDALLAYGDSMGFTGTSGIDLERESTSGFPTVRSYIDSRGRSTWFAGEALNLAIGQGRNVQTLVNMTSFYAALAGDGIKRAPYLYAPRPGTPVVDLKLTPDQLAGLRTALADVVNQGTAAASGGKVLKVAGKTGTGQRTGEKDMGWFIGFAPYDAPKIIVGIAVEEGLHGSLVAQYVVKAIGKYLGVDGNGVVLPVTEDLTVPPDTAGRRDTLTTPPRKRP